MLEDPTLTHRREGGLDIPLLVWRLPAPARAISSAVHGGGLGECRWVINATVPMSYDRDDPASHLAGLARDLGLTGPGVGLLTGVDVVDVVAESAGGVRLWATVGLGAPIQAYDPAAAAIPTRPGTVNVVAWVPRHLSDGALVNAVATITEAKTQAIRDLGLAATGTATDAVCVLCPPVHPPHDDRRDDSPPHDDRRDDSPPHDDRRNGVRSGGGALHDGRSEDAAAAYGGPRSRWGEPLARAAYRAVLAGGRVNLSGPQSWSERSGA